MYLEHFALKGFQRRAPLIEILHGVASTLERIDEKATQAVIVLGEKNLGHGVPHFRP